MIKGIIGGIGSGKTLTCVKEILHNDRKCFVNFDIKFKKAEKLNASYIVKFEDTKKGKKITGVNWDFWNEQIRSGIPFDIFIDEAHNVINSRRAMSGWNINFTKWLTQIRKVLGQSEECHLYLITQRISSIDPVARELMRQIIVCRKIKGNTMSDTEFLTLNNMIKTGSLNDVWILKYYFVGKHCLEKIEAYEMGVAGVYDASTWFYANPLFKYYNSYALVTMGDDEYL